MQATTSKASQKKARKTRANYQNLAGRLSTKEVSSSLSDKLALTHSRYLHSVLDPWNVMGSKIPDEITTPSFPMNASTKIALSGLAGGGSGPNGRGVAYIVGGTLAVNAGKYYVLNPTTTADTYIGTVPSGAWTPGAQLANIAQSCRPVSCGLFVNVQGSFNNNQGRIIIGFVPPFDPLAGTLAGTNNVTATQLDNLAYSTSIPVTKIAGRSIYLPLDDIARCYLVSGASSIAGPRGTGVPTYGLLVALVDGVSASNLPQIEFIVSENFECVPISSQVNIAQPEVSSSDPLEMAMASNFIAARPTIAAFQPTSAQVSGTPLAGGSLAKTDNVKGPTILEKVLAGLSKGVQVAGKIAPVAAEVLAML